MWGLTYLLLMPSIPFPYSTLNDSHCALCVFRFPRVACWWCICHVLNPFHILFSPLSRHLPTRPLSQGSLQALNALCWVASASPLADHTEPVKAGLMYFLLLSTAPYQYLLRLPSLRVYGHRQLINNGFVKGRHPAVCVYPKPGVLRQ